MYAVSDTVSGWFDENCQSSPKVVFITWPILKRGKLPGVRHWHQKLIQGMLTLILKGKNQYG